ncbi:MAG: biopolymer transporter ExbD [Victivallales bacterium]|nr:biopolymer transporter ExbD [Victivallales bacterium]
MRNHHLQSQTDAMPDINMSPMVDMIFLLLIFFMVTTVFTKDAGIGINRPQADTAQPLQQDAMILTITEDGEIRHAGQSYQIKQIPNLVKEQLPDKNGSITIIADKNAPTGLTVQLIDQCRLGGITDVSIAATTETP